MENLNREAILRMLSGKTGNSSSGGGGGDIDLAGYATSIWVTENFVSIEFFRELFRAFDSNSNEILPNDTTSVVASIKAMVGTWTEQYLTALGNAGGGGGGGGGAQYLNDLLDVQLTTPLTDGQALVYNATLQKWVNGAAGVNMTTVWNALSGSTSEQINASHLSTALSGYVTTSDISDMATQTWVGQQGFATQTWVTSNFITIAYFDRLFRAYNGSTLVSHNDTTSTIDNIKAMFGFWTDFYLSALGTGGVSSVSISLSQLADVNVAGVTNGQVLSYNSTNAEWVPTTISNVTSLSALTDVALSSPATYQVLMYDASTTKWYNSALKTINGQPLYGSGDISVGGGASGNYLPLSGGTLTGNLYINTSNGDNGVWADNGNRQIFIGNGASGNSGIYVDSNSISGTWIVGINPNNSVYLNGSALTLTNARTLWGQSFNGSANVSGTITSSHFTLYDDATNPYLNLPCSGNWYIQSLSRGIFMGSTSSKSLMVDANGNVGVCLGDSNPTVRLHVAGGLAVIDDSSDTTYDALAYLRSHSSKDWGLIVDKGSYNYGVRIIASGGYGLWLNGGCNIYCEGAVTALSDARHKTIINTTNLKVEQIARMPAVVYRWNDGREDKELHVGSIAQEWQKVLPEVVMKSNDEEGTLSMQYGVAALVSSIIIARKVVNHEDRIEQLEKENKELKERLNIA